MIASPNQGDALSLRLRSILDGVREGAEDPVLLALLGADLADLVRRVGWNSLAVNPGSTSTKVALYSGLTLLAQDEVRHLPGTPAGVDERAAHIEAWLEAKGLRLAELTGIACRGGFVQAVPGGSYRVSAEMLHDLSQLEYPHASNLAVFIGKRLATLAGQEVILTITDPVTVDECDLVHRITGSARLRTDGTAAHHLNGRAVLVAAAHVLGVPHESLHAVVCHMGGGMSALRYRGGRAVQVAKGFGTMPSANRSGMLPLHQVIRGMEEHSYTLEDLKRDVLKEGGLQALAGTSDFRQAFEVAERGDTPAKREKMRLVAEFFANRIAACVADLSATPDPLDLVLLTGGVAKDAAFCRAIAGRLHLGVPVAVLPGSIESQALVAGLLRVSADPGARHPYAEARDALAAKRAEEDRLLGTPIFERAEGADADRAPRNLADLVRRLSGSPEPPVVAIVGADNEEALLAARSVALDERRIARFLLVGSHARISELAWELDVPLDDETFVLVDSADPVARSIELFEAGLAATLMKGSVTTADLLKGVLGSLKRKGRTGRGLRLSHLSLFDIPGRAKLLGMTDAAINPTPDLAMRLDILENAVEAFHRLGVAQPKVAVVSSIEKPQESLASSIEAREIADRCAGRDDVLVEGPLSVDVALSPAVALEKGYRGRIRGDADLLLMPTLDTGNAVYKAFTVTSGATSAGAVIGGDVPIVLTSRGDSARSKQCSIALALTLARNGAAKEAR